MKFNELIQTIHDSLPEHWQKSYSGLSDNEVFFYTQDVNLRIETSSEDIVVKNFQEEWANKHADTSASSYSYKIYYGNTLIKSVVLVTVDGGRATLPIPKIKSNVVNSFDYKIAQIIEPFAHSLDEYMKLSDLVVEK